MHARVVTLHFDRTHLADGVAAYREKVIPAAQAQGGFTGLLLLLDRDTGQAASMTFWSSAEALSATDQNSYYLDIMTQMGRYFDHAAEREDYEVGVFARGQATQSPKFARVVRATFHASKASQGVKVFSETLIANARKQDGFAAAQLLLNRTSGRAISISLWSSEDALGGGEISPYYIGQIFKLIPFVASLPDREQYEVAAYFDAGGPEVAA